MTFQTNDEPQEYDEYQLAAIYKPGFVLLESPDQSSDCLLSMHQSFSSRFHVILSFCEGECDSKRPNRSAVIERRADDRTHAAI